MFAGGVIQLNWGQAKFPFPMIIELNFGAKK